MLARLTRSWVTARAQSARAVLVPATDSTPPTPLPLFRRDRRNDGQILRTHFGGIELPQVRGHACKELGHAHWRLLALLRRDPANGVAACDDDLPEVRALHAALLKRLHMDRDAVVDVHETHRPLLALSQRGGQRRIHEPIDTPEHRVVGRAGEAVTLFIGGAEGQERGRLEARRVLRLFRARRLLRERARHANDLERAIAQVVRLLGVEREDPVRERRVIRQQSGDRAQPELPRGREAMASVRGPEAVGARDRDDWVQEQARRADRDREPVRVSPREVALERRRLNARNRKRREDERQSRVGIAIGGEDRALRLLHTLGEGGDVLVAAVERGFAGLRPPRLGGAALSTGGLTGRGLLRRGLLRWTHDSPPADATSGTGRRGAGALKCRRRSARAATAATTAPTTSAPIVAAPGAPTSAVVTPV